MYGAKLLGRSSMSNHWYSLFVSLSLPVRPVYDNKIIWSDSVESSINPSIGFIL